MWIKGLSNLVYHTIFQLYRVNLIQGKNNIDNPQLTFMLLGASYLKLISFLNEKFNT